MPHLEFVIPGPPVSYQATDRARLKAWQAAVKFEAMKVWAMPPLTGKLRFLLINFHDGEDPPMDDDNMVKPIRDALNKIVYDDDRQIRYSETIQVRIDDPFKIRRGSRTLFDAFSRGDEFLYVRIEDAPPVIQLPE
jgi:crossover junction endodeoxyribonuclease RusA